MDSLRRRFGFGDAPWLTNRWVRSALGLVIVWSVGTIGLGLWAAATASSPSSDAIDTYLVSVLLPGIALPALILAAAGSRLAWPLLVLFELVDIANNFDLTDPRTLGWHALLAIVVFVAAVVVWRSSPTGEPATSPDVSLDRPALWKRVNVAVVICFALVAYLGFASTAAYAAHHGNLPLLTPALATLVAALGWTASVLFAARAWKRLPLVLSVSVPAVFLVGFAFMTAACPGCTWASH